MDSLVFVQQVVHMFGVSGSALFLQLFLLIQLDNGLVQHISGLAKHILKLQDLKAELLRSRRGRSRRKG